MMTSAPSYTAASAGLPSPALSDSGTDAQQASLSLRLVKRPLVGQPLDACKKRRKQSTPIRISTTESATAIEDDNGDQTSSDGKICGGGIVSGGVSFLPSSPQNRSPVDGCTPTTLVDYTVQQSEHLPTDLQEQEDNNQNQLMISGVSIESPISKTSINATGNQVLLPAWMPDHSIQGPKAAEQSDWLPLQGMAIAGTAPLYLSHLPQSDMQAQSRNSNQPSIRIFNPEAYCELCNKEFCNKYFLKTHKANKHRIYSDPPASEMLMNIPNFTSPVMKQGTLMRNTDTPKNNDTSKMITYNCEICGKGFCYKILLINHKKNAHGITCDIDSNTDSELEQGERQTIKTIDEREPGQLDSIISEEDSQSKTNQFFKNGMPVEVQLVKEESYLEQEDSSFNVTSNCKISSPNQLNQSRENAEITANRLRRMGIMNPEAFCEICCKEYCNKYFLRTHKMKRHGILIPDDGVKDLKQDQSPMNSSWYQIQTSPLNLIMGEQNTNSSGSCGERKSSPTNENECDTCGIRFQTAYLAQLHASNCKGKPLSEMSEQGIKIENSIVTNNNDKHPITSTADAISEDLQKLQSMILQLNNLGENKISTGVTTCSLCNKDFENRYFLQAHMMSEHNIFPDENLEEKRETEMNEMLVCKLCGREGLTPETFKQHMIESHNPASSEIKEDSNEISTPEKSVSRGLFASPVSVERRSSVSLTPTSSYCEICNKELCNKYFMKTHMQRMHGIEIENGAQIGGVVCNICNKELCSKYFLRVHKHNTHGIVEEGSGSGSSQSRQVGCEIDGSSTQIQPPTSINTSQSSSEAIDTALKPDLADLSHRYFSHFSEVCTICNRRFRSTKWLKAHLLGDHGKAGTEKWNELEIQLQQSFGQQQRTNTFNKTTPPERTSPMLKIPNGGGANINDKEKVSGVQNVLSSLFGSDDSNVKQYFCSYCSFSTPVLAFLFVHERSHSRSEQDTDAGVLQCAVCSQTFRQPEILQHHILSQHPFLPMSPIFGNVLQQSSTGQGSKPILQTPDTEQSVVSKTTDPEHRCTNCSQCKAAGAKKQQQKETLDIGFSLMDVCKQSSLPATYALPQTAAASRYVMQAFLMDEPVTTDNQRAQQTLSTGGSGDRKFAPSIVFLPVLERLNAPLTVSFTLTPT